MSIIKNIEMVAGDRFALPMFLAYETGMVTGPYPRNYLSMHVVYNNFDLLSNRLDKLIM